MSIPEDKEELEPLLFYSHSRPAFLSKKQRLHVTTPLGRISPVVMEIRKVHPNGGTAAMGQIESRLRLLSRLDQHVSANSGPQVLVKTALDAGLELSGAAFGACLYPVVGVDGAHSQLVEVSGFGPSTDRVPVFQGTADQSRKEANEAPIPKLKAGVATGTDLPGFFTGLLPSSFTVRSSIVVPLLSLPLPSASAEPPGYLFYAHADPDVFTPETELLVSFVAAQLSIALRNAQLTDTLTREATVVARALAAQRLTDRRLAQALEAAQLGTWNWDAASGLIDFDERAAALFGVEPHRPLSRDALRERVVYADDLHHSPVDLHDFLRSKGQYSAEYRIDALDGVQRWIYANGRAVLSDATGEVAGLTGTVQDISERKKQESSLRTSEKLAAAGRLAASIAHEINNPLEAVTNLIYLAKTDPETPPGIARLLETADNELARVSQIAQQTLGFYRDTTHPVSIDLNHLLQAVVELFERKLHSKRLHCTLDLEPRLSIVGLQGEIRQVISNLLVNAIDASSHNGGRIQIRGRRQRRDGSRGVSVLIADQGAGVPHSVRHRLFTPFVTTKQSTGTGLGLWVTRGMVEKHGGSVRFRSRTESPSGTVFRVYLPQSAHPQLFAAHASGILQ